MAKFANANQLQEVLAQLNELPVKIPFNPPPGIALEEGSTSDGSSEGGAAARDGTGRSSSTDSAFQDYGYVGEAPAAWNLPMPGNRDFCQDAATAASLSALFPQLGGAPTPGGLTDQMAKQWLQKEVAELAELVTRRESEMQMLAQQMQTLSLLQPRMIPPEMNQVGQGGIEWKIQLLRQQLDDLTSQLRPAPTTPTSFMMGATEPPEDKNVYTVMMRNIPNKYTQRLLIDEINFAGFEGSYDFVYLPIDKESGANKGYAFINFLRPTFAYAFKHAFNGKQMAQFKSNKIVNVTPAAIQGFEANHAHFSRTRVNYGDPDARPLFLRKEPSHSPTRGASQSPKMMPPGLGQAQEIAAAAAMQFHLPGAMNHMQAEVGGYCGYCPNCGTRRHMLCQFCQGCGRNFAPAAQCQ